MHVRLSPFISVWNSSNGIVVVEGDFFNLTFYKLKILIIEERRLCKMVYVSRSDFFYMTFANMFGSLF